MSVIGHSPLAGASGAAGGGGPLYVDDVFSTFLYKGNGSAQTITNGIDLSGEGGLVWAKVRNSTIDHHLVDTERGGSKYLRSSSTSAEGTDATMITSFNSDGFSIGSSVYFSQSPRPYATWTFRKAPGFFDVVTYNGTGSAQNISHSLGSVPGMIMIHCRDGTHNWEVYHRSTGATKSLHLNTPDTPVTDSTVWNNTTPTSSVFTVGTSSNVNQNGHGYVAYVFAHDEQAFGTDEDKAIIKCGTYTGNGGNQEINIGFEAQWLLMRNNSIGTNWFMVNNMMGDKSLVADELGAEVDNSYGFDGFKANGFAVKSNNANFNASGSTYIYMAIRRPHKPPTAGTEVFVPVTYAGTGSTKIITTGFPVDLSWANARDNAGDAFAINDRIRGNGVELYTNGTSAEYNSGSAGVQFDLQTTLQMQSYRSISGKNYFAWNFKRAPGFFDVVTYTGTGSARTVNHNLGVAPELMIVKRRSDGGHWYVYDATLGNTYVNLLSAYSQSYTSSEWNNTSPTSSVFTVGTSAVNGSGSTFVAYLFASLDGISKVGSYSGTGSNINVDCGFTAGARFVLIKRTDATGDWYVWDTARGIVSGNDPYVLVNTGNAEVTNTDYIDPLNAGFTVTSSAPAALNTSGGSYMFLAIA